eukprot:7771149-Lingulodinium_polyedra.AAC.1
MPGQRGADKHAAKCAKLPWALPAAIVHDLDKLAEDIRAAKEREDALAAALAAVVDMDQDTGSGDGSGPGGGHPASSGLDRSGGAA